VETPSKENVESLTGLTGLSSPIGEFCFGPPRFFQIGAHCTVLNVGFEMRRLRAPVIALIAAIVTAVFVVPRRQSPRDVPYPPVVAAQTEHVEIAERARVAALTGLHVDIRGIGERIRRVSVLEVAGPSELYLSERARLRTLVRGLLREHREGELRDLRDLQAVLFVSALETHWREASPETEAAIRELGANILTYLNPSNAWLETYALLPPTLTALFCDRWATLLDVRQHLLLAPSANAHRLIQRFLVLYQLKRGAQRDNQQLLTLLADVQRYSPEYPSEYARGIVLYEMGAFPDAIAAFERHLTRHPDGPWTARAHNFRLEAIHAATE
jgi:hypothetical protein